MSEWKEYKLGDVAIFKNGKSRPTEEGTFPIYGGNGILGYTNQFNSENEVVVVGRVGAYCGSVYYENKQIWISDNALFALPKNRFDTKFLFYFLENLNLNQFAEGSSHPLLTQNLLNSIDVQITDDLEEQKSIASILSSLDDKIDLLHRQNQTLEALAETLFRQWFVEKAEESWGAGKLGDYGEFKNGINYSRDEAGNTTYGIINVRDVMGNKFIFKEAVNEINIDFRKAEPYLLQKFDIVIVRSASPGETALILENQKKLIYSGFTIRFRPHKEREAFFFFQLMQSIKKHLDIFSDGTTLKNLNQEILKNIEFQVPSFESIETFNEKAEPIFDKISKNLTQIRTLTRLRDTLLPKLMSGEVRAKI